MLVVRCVDHAAVDSPGAAEEIHECATDWDEYSGVSGVPAELVPAELEVEKSVLGHPAAAGHGRRIHQHWVGYKAQFEGALAHSAKEYSVFGPTESDASQCSDEHAAHSVVVWQREGGEGQST